MKPILVSQSKPSDGTKRTPSGVIMSEDTFSPEPVVGLDEPHAEPVDSKVKPAGENKDISQINIPTPTEDGPEIETDEEFMADYKDVSLDELIVSGYVTHTAKIHDKIVVELRSLKKIENMRVDKNAVSYQGSNAYVLNEISLDALSISVQSINGKSIGDKLQDKKKYLANLAEVIIQAIWDEYRKLNKATAVLLMGSSKNSLTRRLVGPGLT